jgi:AraC-like DNA-binding protein
LTTQISSQQLALFSVQGPPFVVKSDLGQAVIEVVSIELTQAKPNCELVSQGLKMLQGVSDPKLMPGKNSISRNAVFNTLSFYTWIYGLIILITIATFAQIFGLFNLMNIKSKHILLEESRVIVKVLIVDYFLINLILILFPKIMYGLPIENLQNNSSIVSEPFNRMKVVIANHEDAENSTTSSSVEKSPLFLFTKQYVDEMDLHIKCCIEKLHYLDPNFQMDSLCKSFNIPYHHWTFYFNDIKQQTFIEWKNRTRINYAKEKIIDGYLDSKTFQSLATECGFNTQSTFIRVFKIYTGKNPGDYIKSI